MGLRGKRPEEKLSSIPGLAQFNTTGVALCLWLSICLNRTSLRSCWTLQTCPFIVTFIEAHDLQNWTAPAVSSCDKPTKESLPPATRGTHCVHSRNTLWKRCPFGQGSKVSSAPGQSQSAEGLRCRSQSLPNGPEPFRLSVRLSARCTEPNTLKSLQKCLQVYLLRPPRLWAGLGPGVVAAHIAEPGNSTGSHQHNQAGNSKLMALIETGYASDYAYLYISWTRSCLAHVWSTVAQGHRWVLHLCNGSLPEESRMQRGPWGRQGHWHCRTKAEGSVILCHILSFCGVHMIPLVPQITFTSVPLSCKLTLYVYIYIHTYIYINTYIYTYICMYCLFMLQGSPPNVTVLRWVFTMKTLDALQSAKSVHVGCRLRFALQILQALHYQLCLLLAHMPVLDELWAATLKLQADTGRDETA